MYHNGKFCHLYIFNDICRNFQNHYVIVNNSNYNYIIFLITNFNFAKDTKYSKYNTHFDI